MPFTHFTNSSSLIFLPKTDFVICSVNTMLYHYAIAPMSGEISRGGIQGFQNPTTSFAKLKKTGHYNFERLYRDYGAFVWQPLWKNSEELEHALIENSADSSLIEFRSFLVNLLRHKQMGQLPEISISVKEKFLKSLVENSNRVKCHFAAIYATARFVSIKAGQAQELTYYNEDSIVNLYKKIPLNFLELSDKEQLEYIKTSVLSERYEIFDAFEKSQPKSFNQEEYDYNFSFACRFPGDSRCLTYILDTIKGAGNIPNIQYFQEKISAVIDEVNKAVTLCERILDNRFEQLLDSSAIEMTRNAFPIAFVLEDSQSHQLKQIREDEYHSILPLQLGQNISTIATDLAHIAELTEFCARFEALKHVNIMSFERLRELEENKMDHYLPLRQNSIFEPKPLEPKPANNYRFCSLL